MIEENAQNRLAYMNIPISLSELNNKNCIVRIGNSGSRCEILCVFPFFDFLNSENIVE